MGKETGFLEIQREESHYRPVKERLADYRDVNLYADEKTISRQGSRCMDCGIPFCHAIGCPLFNLIPEWNDYVYKNKWKEAYERLTLTNFLPEITGRICPAPCEASCTLSINDSPVTIRQIECAVIERAFSEGLVKPRLPRRESGKKIAVIGSGPAGLTAADRLRSFGHSVTIFEKSSKPGGLLRYGIPDFKLEKHIIDRRIEIMKSEGINFETGINAGKDISLRYLQEKFSAVLIAAGSGVPRDIDIPGRTLNGVHFAMEFLTGSNLAVSGESAANLVNAAGKTVIVIGGGDTGSDCVGTANRQGAKKVYQFEILPRPPEHNETWNPVWPEWPKILRTSSSHEEGVQRDWSIITRSFHGNGDLQKVLFSRAEWEKNEKGSWNMKELKGTEHYIQADLALIAAGFVHTEHSGLVNDAGLDLDKQGNILVKNYASSVRGIFAAGDAATGASLAVRAVYHGREAAEEINRYLK